MLLGNVQFTKEKLTRVAQVLFDFDRNETIEKFEKRFERSMILSSRVTLI